MFKKLLGIERYEAKIMELEDEILFLQNELEETETVQDCIVESIEGDLEPPSTIRKLTEALGLIYCNLNFITDDLPRNGEFEDNQNVIYNIWAKLSGNED